MTEDDGLIREVNEAVRQEQWQQLWRALSKYVIAASGVILLLTIAYVLWQRSVQATHEADTAALYKAIQLVRDGNSYQAREQFEVLAAGKDTAQSTLAKIWLVKLKYQAGKKDEAAAMATKLSQDAPKVYRDWALLYAQSGAEQKNEAFRHSSQENRAVLLMKAGDLAEAATIYRMLAEDSETPPTMRTRAQFLLDTYLKQTSDDVPGNE